MFIKNCFPRIVSKDTGLEISNFEFSKKGHELVNQLMREYEGSDSSKFLRLFLLKLLQISLIAGYIKNPQKDYVLFDGGKKSFFSSDKTIGRVPVAEIIKRDDALSFAEWARVTQKFLQQKIDDIDSVTSNDVINHDLLMKNETWAWFVYPEQNYSPFLESIFDIFVSSTETNLFEDLKN